MSTLKEQWAEVYQMLDLGREFEEFHLRNPIMMPLDGASGLWLIPVIAGVTIGKIFEGFETKGVKVIDRIGLGNRSDLVLPNSYLVATDGGTNLPIRMASIPEKLVGLMNIQEYFLINLWHLIAYASCLDDSSVTVCSGTRLDGWRIPCVLYFSKTKVVDVHESRVETMGNRCGPRLAYAP